VVADHVDDRGAGLAGVVQVGQPVAEAGPEVEERGRRAVGHAGVPVGGAGHDALEQPEDAPHLRHRVEGGHEVHLGRAGVGEAGVHPRSHQGADQRLRPVEALAAVPLTRPRAGPGRLVGHASGP
jgi:hypothetical protein